MALQAHEDSLCPGCGQLLSESMEPALAEFWGAFPPVTCHGCAALATAQESVKDWKHPHTARHRIGLNTGWEEALAAKHSTPDQ